MARYSGEGVLPISRGRLWEFLRLHSDPTIIAQIHPEVLRQSIVRSSATEVVLDRTLRVPGNRTLSSTWNVRLDPPGKFRWEIVGGEGPLEIGSWVESRYTEGPEGTTWIRTEAEMTIQKVPRLFQKMAVRRVLHSIDAQDSSYLGTHP